jgi:hypothetical protein
MKNSIDRADLIARRDLIQVNVTEARRKLRDLEQAIYQGEGALLLLDDLLALPGDTPAAPVA